MNDLQSPDKKIVWLASYPKSGNTWFRAFLTALLKDGELDINEMESDIIFSSRFIFDAISDLDSTYLYDSEVKVLQPDVYNYLASKHEKERLFIKIHDAYIVNQERKPIVPTASTLCGIYFIRNPLDMAASLANHNGTSINRAVKLLNNTTGGLLNQIGNYNLNQQFPQLTFDWSGHVKSWMAPLPFPVLIIRYEDMLSDSFNTFSKATKFIGINSGDDKVKGAIAATKFERLKEKEKEKGFAETMSKSTVFFRQGQAGNWRNELTGEQAALIVNQHKTVMELFGYNTSI